MWKPNIPKLKITQKSNNIKILSKGFPFKLWWVPKGSAMQNQ